MTKKLSQTEICAEEYILALRHWLRMNGSPLEGSPKDTAAYVRVDRADAALEDAVLTARKARAAQAKKGKTS